MMNLIERLGPAFAHNGKYGGSTITVEHWTSNGEDYCRVISEGRIEGTTTRQMQPGDWEKMKDAFEEVTTGRIVEAVGAW